MTHRTTFLIYRNACYVIKSNTSDGTKRYDNSGYGIRWCSSVHCLHYHGMVAVCVDFTVYPRTSCLPSHVDIDGL